VDYMKYSYSEYAKVIDLQTPAQVKAWQSGSIEDWFYESHVLSDRIYDGTPPESKLKYKYIFDYSGMLNEQLVKGGVRLAELLNRTFE